jgi:ubiquitin-protein ligase
MSVQQLRKAADFDKLKAFAARSNGAVTILSTTGNPPTQYVVRINCRSLEAVRSGSPAFRNAHELKINLSANYPLGKPTVTMVTPIFNPHIFSSGSFCLGDSWNPAESLDVFIQRLIAIIVCDPVILDPRSPANTDAMKWVQANRQQLPFDSVTIAQQAAPASRIVWTDS